MSCPPISPLSRVSRVRAVRYASFSPVSFCVIGLLRSFPSEFRSVSVSFRPRCAYWPDRGEEGTRVLLLPVRGIGVVVCQ